MKYICTKDLFMDEGDRVFTFGKVYECDDKKLTYDSCITDDTNCRHILGNDKDGGGKSWKNFFIPENFKVKNK